MKILIHSNAPWAGTGYGQQTALFVPKLARHHDVAISAFWGLKGAAIAWNGIRVYPADEGWGNANLAAYARHHAGGDGRCLVVTLMDVWVLNAPSLRELNLASWVPVDHEPLPPRVLNYFSRTGARPIAMSRFGEAALAEAGLDPLYVPHGIDTAVFKPNPEARAEVREAIGVPEDAFVVGMVAANKGVSPPRKAFPQVFQAFARFRERHPEAFLYLHTELSGRHQGLNLGHLAASCGIPTEAVKFTPPLELELGVDAEVLAKLYTAFDVLANPSYGEGFGIPIVEAQACGIPVITTEFSAMPELTGAGWMVGGERFYDPGQGAFMLAPSIEALTEVLEDAFKRRVDDGLREKARRFALQYDAERVLHAHWLPALEELAEAEAEREPRELEAVA